MPHTAEVEPSEVGQLRHEAVLGRCLAEHGDAEPVQEIEPLVDVEPAVVEDELGTTRPGPEQDVPDRLRPPCPGGAPDEIAGPRIKPVLSLQARRPRVAVRVDGSLGMPRRAGGVEDEGRVGGARVVGRLHGGVRLELGNCVLDEHDVDLCVHAGELRSE